MPNSMTHHHLCAVINTLLKGRAAQQTIRILDMGCGNGELIAFLQDRLPHLRGDLHFELYGFDVTDSKVQTSGYFDGTVSLLRQKAPEIEWEKRLHLITSTQSWPFEEGYFDFVISNQVMEHVFDHDFSLRQIRRVLTEAGRSIHVFPLKSYIYEGHIFVPFAHWISNRDLLFEYLKICSWFGLGSYKKFFPKVSAADLNAFSRRMADYLIFETNYLTLKEVHQLAKRNKMGCSFQYTEEYYINKLRLLARRPIAYEYSQSRHPWWERILFSLCVRLASITLILDKQNTYSI